MDTVRRKEQRLQGTRLSLQPWERQTSRRNGFAAPPVGAGHAREKSYPPDVGPIRGRGPLLHVAGDQYPWRRSRPRTQCRTPEKALRRTACRSGPCPRKKLYPGVGPIRGRGPLLHVAGDQYPWRRSQPQTTAEHLRKRFHRRRSGPCPRTKLYPGVGPIRGRGPLLHLAGDQYPLTL